MSDERQGRAAAGEQLFALLRPDYGPDLWSDDVIARVGRALDALPEEGWARLAAAAPQQPVSWRVRLAQALFTTQDPHTVPLLLDLVAAPEAEVFMAAAETLIEKRFVDPERRLRRTLDGQLAHADPATREALRQLATRLPA
jgi:hypothetical protein